MKGKKKKSPLVERVSTLAKQRGMTMGKLASVIGISRVHLYRELADPHGSPYIGEIAKLIGVAQKDLRSLLPKEPLGLSSADKAILDKWLSSVPRSRASALLRFVQEWDQGVLPTEVEPDR
jgi:transcriptional regulator with XRE-family HTH domain